MKQRFSSLDLTVISHELAATLVGHRLSSIYDLSSRIFLLKFAKPNSKHSLIIDSGFRCHLTSFVRETASTPSSFVARLRKYLKTRRLTTCRQLGIDRILQLSFSDGLYHVFLEFFAGGNVILTDTDFTILAVLRIVSAGDDGRGECKVGVKYDISGKDYPGPVTRERIITVLEAATAASEDALPAEIDVPKKKYQKKKKKVDESLKRLFGGRMSEFPPALIERSLQTVGIRSDTKASEVLASEDLIEKVLAAFREAEKTIATILQRETVKGYIVARLPVEPGKGKEAREGPTKKSVGFGGAEAIESTDTEPKQKVQEGGEAAGYVYDDFHPFRPQVDAPGVKVLELEGFNKTVDQFYSSIESQKLESRLKEREAIAARRLESARTEHEKRVEGLRSTQELNIRKAQAIEANLDRVEEALAAVNSLVSQGMDWVAMDRLIEAEKKRGNAVAELVQLPLRLFENTITLKLREVDWEAEWDDNDSGYDETEDEDSSSEEEEKEEPKQKALGIDVDLGLSAYANARNYYDQKRTAAQKETKTLQASTKSLKSAEKKITADLQKSLKTEKKVLQPARKPLWFEKFLYFISSDGYLVLGARDLQQAEHLYKRHLRRGDVWLHADVQGAATAVVKNNPATPNAPIPPGTLQQAGTMCVATSKAWDSKAGMSAWWVGFDQVSKLAPHGEYLDTGVFTIKGTKNFLPPAQLILGYGVLWRVDEESKKRHARHRVEEPKDEGVAVEPEKAAIEAPVGGSTEEKEGEAKEGAADSPEEEDSDDEEFPDAKIESGGEEEQSDDEENFSDAQIEESEPTPGSPQEKPAEQGPGDKHDLNASSELAPSEASFITGSAPSGKRHLSVKQRKDLKKYGHILDTTPSASTVASSTDATPPSTPAPSQASSGKSKTVPTVRGKKGKQKKAAQKYAFQDEEDLAIARSLLGAAGPANESSTPAEAAPKETPEQRKARLREQHKKAQAVGLAEETRRHTAVDDEDQEAEDEIARMPLDALIPDPREDDVLLDAIPVCAPWGAMGRYKYRVKMQPGAVKKGKAIREVWSGWVDDKRGSMKGREKELVGAWRESELINCVGVGKVKVFGSAVGGEKGGAKGGKGKGGTRGGKGSKKK